jgi:hypothetical protein
MFVYVLYAAGGKLIVSGGPIFYNKSIKSEWYRITAKPRYNVPPYKDFLFALVTLRILLTCPIDYRCEDRKNVDEYEGVIGEIR